MNKAIVIGSGISGLSISRMLSKRFDVEILEKATKYGGLIKCDRINGNLFHRVGGHVFNCKNQVVLDWFWRQFDRDNEFLKANRNARILLRDSYINYPLENYLYQLPEQDVRVILVELMDKSKQKQSSEYQNFKEFLIGNFGNRLYDLYFGPYNTKIWNTDLSNVPLGWLDGKLPMPDIQDIILNNVLKREESKMVHSSFFYSKRDGSQFIVNRLAEGLSITCSYTVNSISIGTNKKLSVNSKDKEGDCIVYSGDVRKLRQIIKIEDIALEEAMNKVEKLISNGTSNVLCETDDNDISWLYLPEEQYKAHRIIYTGNFSSSNNEGTKRKTCVVEFSGNQDKETMLAEIKKLPGNLNPLAFNFEPNSYVVQNKSTRSDIAHLKSLLKPYNIYLLGRFAEWEYYNMDKCIEAAMELKKELFSIPAAVNQHL